MTLTSLAAALPVDGRQSQTALAIARGTARYLHALGYCVVMHCDRLFFATVAEVPCEIFPGDAGLIVADAFGASIVCEAPEHRLPAATRKTVMLRFAHAAALRLQALADPQGPYAGEF